MMPSARPMRVSVALATILLLCAAPGRSQDAPPADRALLVLLDVSGSMREPVRGGVKNDLAIRGLLRTLESLPAGTIAGLRLMGEGTLGSAECGATRTLIPMKPFARAEWDGAIQTVGWKGSTPLVHSMRAALADLRAVPARRRELLIIGDGEETCGEDPVGMARAEAGDIRIHGISLGEDVSHQLAGVALVADGTYARAFDDASFGEAAGVAIPGVVTTPGTAAADASAAPATRLEVILDVSNSMWGQVDGRAKIELAREALTRALADAPPDLPIGLRAYGHRVGVDDKAAGCADTQRLVVPAAGTGGQIVQLANGLTPRGQTPIARSLQEAGADLRAEGGAGVILLLSDGVESCGGDPEAATAQLRASGLQVILHTVGLGVSAEEATALTAIATAGGGSYFNAPNAADLVRGIGAAVQSSREFVLQQDDVATFPQNIPRVTGGATAASTEIVEPGLYSFTDHLFREYRYFAVRGTPGTTIRLRGMVCALEIGRTRDGVVTFQGAPNMMFGEAVDAEGERLRGAGLQVRGDMGTWEELPVRVGADGLARFRLGRPQGNVHRDMIFEIVR